MVERARDGSRRRDTQPAISDLPFPRRPRPAPCCVGCSAPSYHVGSPLGHALEGVRVLPARLSGKKLEPLAGRSFLDVTPIPVLFSERPHVVISAGLSQAWRLLGGSIPPHLDAAALRAWSQPGWIKAGMEFRLEPVSAGTLLSTKTRVLATDPKTRRAFAGYWFVIRPSSSAIRREVLKVVARHAESSLKAR
jgi:hypothetical protein